MDTVRLTPQPTPVAATPRAVLEQNSSLLRAASKGEAASLVRKQPVVTSAKKSGATERLADRRRRRRNPLDNKRSTDDLGTALDARG